MTQQQEQLEAILNILIYDPNISLSLDKNGDLIEPTQSIEAITALIQEAEERGYRKHAQEVVDTIEASWVSGGSNNE